MAIDWMKAVGASFDIVITVSVCAFLGYYICGGRLNEATPLSIFGLAVGALLGLFITIYGMIRIFEGGK